MVEKKNEPKFDFAKPTLIKLSSSFFFDFKFRLKVSLIFKKKKRCRQKQYVRQIIYIAN